MYVGNTMEPNKEEIDISAMNEYLDKYSLFVDMCRNRHIVDERKVLKLWQVWVDWDVMWR